MNWLCRLFGHRLNTGSGPSEGHWCARSWGRGQWAGKCDWCNCKEHGCIDCHGRDYVPPPAYMWCVERGGEGRYDPDQSAGTFVQHIGRITEKQKEYLRGFYRRGKSQLHPDVARAIESFDCALEYLARPPK